MKISNSNKNQVRISLSTFLIDVSNIYKQLNKSLDFDILLRADHFLKKETKMPFNEFKGFCSFIVEVRHFCFNNLEKARRSDDTLKFDDLGALYFDRDIFFSLLGFFPAHEERLYISKIEVIQAVTNDLLEMLDEHEITPRKFSKEMRKLTRKMIKYAE